MYRSFLHWPSLLSFRWICIEMNSINKCNCSAEGNLVLFGLRNSKFPVFKGARIALFSRRASSLEDSVEVKFVKSSGPGGQHVNKVNSKAEVRLKVQEADWIPFDVREKLLEQEKNRINKDGVLVVTSEKFRTQSRNLNDALDKIRQMITEASYVPKNPSEDQVSKILARIEKENEKRLQDKKYRSEKKKSRFVI